MKRHKEILDKMTVEEKAALLSGKTVFGTRDIKRLGIEAIQCSDGPHGVRRQLGASDHLGLNKASEATCFPTAATMANSWDTKLGELVGEALGEEASDLDVDILLGPGLNIKRSPLCGRNFEYFSEDPYLSGKMAASYIRGIQKKGVYACPKHFAVNSQETRRMAMNSVVDERTLREIYLTGFEIAVKEGNPGAIMTSYNEVNGIYANENPYLLQTVLREEWGFDGIVITDWGGSNDHVQGVKMNSNLEMPAPGADSPLTLLNALKDGSLKEEELDTCVDTLLGAVLDLQKKRQIREKTKARQIHHMLAKRAARESAVLLKNENNILPLDKDRSVVVIGDFAFQPRYQGAGSSAVNAWKTETLLEELKKMQIHLLGYSSGYIRTGEADEKLLREAVELARCADVVIFCFGLNEICESEGIDRMHMRIPENQIHLLKKLHEVNPNIVGVLSAGASIEMDWEENCMAILHGYLNGQAGAGAIAELLTGEANPCGKLAETYPFHYEDTPAYSYFLTESRNAEYREGIYVGYRYYDTAKKEVRYPFGYGLSYTQFSYSDFDVMSDRVSFVITNTGKYEGAEIAQMYVAKSNSLVFRAAKELKGFKKVFLKPGESKQVTILFDDKTFRYWNRVTHQFEIEDGSYEILIGSDSRSIRLKGICYMPGTNAILPYKIERMKSYYSAQIQNVPDSEYEELLGGPIPTEDCRAELTINDAICQMKYAKSRLCRGIYHILNGIRVHSEKKGKPDLNVLFIYNMPFRGIAKMTNGMVSMEMAQGMVDAVNGHLIRGIGSIVGGFIRNKRANKEFEEKL